MHLTLAVRGKDMEAATRVWCGGVQRVFGASQDIEGHWFQLLFSSRGASSVRRLRPGPEPGLG